MLSSSSLSSTCTLPSTFLSEKSIAGMESDVEITSKLAKISYQHP